MEMFWSDQTKLMCIDLKNRTFTNMPLKQFILSHNFYCRKSLTKPTMNTTTHLKKKLGWPTWKKSNDTMKRRLKAYTPTFLGIITWLTW